MKASDAVIKLDDLTNDLFTDVSVIEIVKHLTEIGQRIDKEHLRKSLIFFFMNIENGYRENNLEKTTGAIVTLFRNTSLNDYVDYLQIGLMAHYGVPVGEEDRSVNSLDVADRILEHNRILGFVVNIYLCYIDLYQEAKPVKDHATQLKEIKSRRRDIAKRNKLGRFTKDVKDVDVTEFVVKPEPKKAPKIEPIKNPKNEYEEFLNTLIEGDDKEK
jgi:hypothetical protein